VLDTPAVVIGLLLTLCGFFFKLAVFPFHFWAPDVYQGAANQATAYIATASKVAAVAILTRMVAVSGDGSIYLIHVLVTLAIVSMTVGNLAAIVQKDFKRLLAYSTVAHAGYVLIGILSMNAAGYMSAIFYVTALLFMKFTVFLVIVKVADESRNLEISHLAGLHKRSPLLAMALMVAIFSLAGIPPTIGFTGKFLVFIAALEKGYFALVLIAMINVVISLYYYLLILKAAYLLEPGEVQPAVELSTPIKFLTGALVLVMVVAGIFPRYLIELAGAAAGALM
jgi:NADH-quinone oxidoreductase subunit N